VLLEFVGIIVASEAVFAVALVVPKITLEEEATDDLLVVTSKVHFLIL